MTNFEKWQKIKNEKIAKKLATLSESEIADNFSNSLVFGTAGMRGEMKLGTNCMNEITVCKLAHAVSKYVEKNLLNKSVTICFDTRLGSKIFSRIFANVLAHNNIKVYLSKNFTPTPVCVHATSKIFASGLGVMITASHNPKQYNGIKIYNGDGTQINKKQTAPISKLFDSTDEVAVYNEIYDKKLSSDIIYFSSEVEKDFCKTYNKKKETNLNIVYTNLNGTGYNCVKKVLSDNNFKFKTPASQKTANGYFKTCAYPNPEFEHAFSESLKIANKSGADIIIATDPDADRLGVMVFHNGKYVKLSGDEVGYIFLDYLAKKNNSNKKFAVTSVVTSPLSQNICDVNKVKLYKTLTGFASLGGKMKEMILKQNENDFVLCYEESCGYVVKSSYYDKDGVFASLLLCEIAQKFKLEEKTLVDYLNQIYDSCGYLENVTENIKFEGASAFEDMQKCVDKLRKNQPKEIGGEKIEKVVDYLNDNTSLDKQNFLEFVSSNIKFIVRPSGTEPKLKVYVFVYGNKTDNISKTLEKVVKEIKTKILKV